MKQLLQRLPARAVLGGLFLVFIIPFGLVVNRLVEEIKISVEFATKEQLGVRYNSALRQLLQEVAQHQQLTHTYLTQTQAQSAQLQQKQITIGQTVQTIELLDQELNPQLKTTTYWHQIRNQWLTLQRHLTDYSPETNLVIHQELLNQIQQLMAHAGDTSNLILDPNLDTYYLMDAVVTNLPQMLKHTIRARELLVEITRRQTMTIDEKVTLIVLYNSIQTLLADLDRGAHVAFDFNPSLEPQLQPYFNLHGLANQDFLQILRRTGVNPHSHPELCLELANRAISEQFSLYDALAPNLHQLLQIRIDRLNQRKRQVQLFGIAVAVAVLALFVAIARNQLKRQQAETTLRERESLLRLAMKSAGMGAWSWNLQSGEEFWSKGMWEIFGIPDGTTQPNYQWLFQLIHPDDRDRILQQHQAVMTNDADYDIEFRIHRPDGTMHWVNSQGRMVRDETGTPLQVTGVAMDITNRKLAEAALQKAEENYRSIFENAADGIFQTTVDGTYLSANPALADILGYDSPAELMQILSHQIEEKLYVDPSRRSEFIQLIDQYGLVTDFELQVYRRDGSTIWISENARAVRDSEGQLLYYEGIVKNISDRKRAAEELFNAKEAAELANRAKSQFLANMSHELRTPLNAIIGYSEMLQEEATDFGYDDIVPDLEKIQGAGKHLLGLINDILDISKIEAGKMDLYLEDFNIAALINDVQTTVQPLIEQRGNRLVVQVSPQVGQMRSDITKVQQILFNLLSNAAKFTENGSITLTVAANQEQAEAIATIVFTVTDTGIGIAAEKLPHLFQPFMQADTSTTRKYGGTGLGLAITQRFCQMMQGQIQVQSRLGQGSEFTVWLPRHLDSPAPVPSSLDDELAHPDLAVPHTGVTVLVIDDDASVRDLIVRQLGKEGYHVAVASSGQEGLHLARTLLPDVITLDVMMPTMDGWEVLSTLKADPDLATIPVIVMTVVEEEQLGFTLGASDYLPKPIDYKRLVQLLQQYQPSPGSDRSAIGHVLVVDDDPYVRELFERLLPKANWQVSTAENGQIALQHIAQQPPDVVVLDLMMPEVDGFQVLSTLQQHADWRSIPVIIITAMTLTVEEENRLRGSVAQILAKHAYSPEALLAEVKARLQPPIQPQR